MKMSDTEYNDDFEENDAAELRLQIEISVIYWEADRRLLEVQL
ncbi:hypothetical protein A943_03270 [Bacillus sp. CPSM8]|nr:hypothetical protein A943_03270 [Bacillus sp. CPSM8]KFM92312.1 hypothetical protein DJ88_3104 [Bacillus paralicheniformis]KUL12319.1 hypothetical protein LI7559_09220 [Bacillus licheniformis LMG 7559]KUL16043.1 hypothetical protein LI6934_17640 [Bacillus licheniformis LMG 6934]GIN75527.1 hypothetical protein J41TS8_05680 [Bacillus sp. J41TS8]